MARQKEPPKPVYPTLHEYEASIKNALHEMTMLLQVVKFIVETPEVAPKLQGALKERYEAAHKAIYGDQ